MQQTKTMTAANTTPAIAGGALDREAVQLRIPHRDPMLLVDALTDIVPNESCTGIKHVRPDDLYFQGHFPGKPIMPGVLIIEAMAQTAGALVVDAIYGGQPHNDLVYFMSIESARFRHPVVPGDTLHLKVKKERQRGNVWRFRGEAFVGTRLCAEATYTAMLVSPEQQQKS